MLGRAKGVTLVELMIALAISSILIAGIYRVLIHHERIHATHEQIADMQQNLRVAITRMIREIRMAGFGGKNENLSGDSDFISVFGNVNGYEHVIHPADGVSVDGIHHDQITVMAAYEEIGILESAVNPGDTSLSLNYLGNRRFDTESKRYLCLNGRDNYVVGGVNGDIITLQDEPIEESHSAGESVFLVTAVTYGLRMDSKHKIPVLFRNENTGGGRQTVAENIESLQFRYRLSGDAEGMVDSPTNPKDIRGVEVTLTARTLMKYPQAKGDGFLRRSGTAFVNVRNLRDP